MTIRYQGTCSLGSAASTASELAARERLFLAALEAATLPPEEFDHAAHVRAGYLYLRRHAFPQATAALCATIARYSRAIGKPDRYHETITVAFMSLINAQLRRGGDSGDWEAFRAANPQLFRPDVLLAYYPREVLESPEARAAFTLMPLAG
jgi:hypothetical protein